MSDPDSLTVLLVEDNPADTALFRALLGHTLSFEQRHADTLAGAIAELEATDIDAILLDLGLPDSDAEQTWRRIHEIAPWAAVIVLTGHDDRGVDLGSLAEGAQDFLVKNDVTETLLAKTIRYAVERHRAFRAQLDQRVQELEIYESLGVSPATSPDDQAAPQTIEEGLETYRSVLIAAVADGSSANEAEFVVQLRDLAGRLADRRATPTDLAAIHTETLSNLQTTLSPEQFAAHEDVARLLLLRLTGELANQYLRRGPAGQGGTDADRSPDGEPAPQADTTVVPDDARERLVAALETLIPLRPLVGLTLDDLADEAQLDRRAAAEAVPGVLEPFGELARQEFARQRDLADVMLVGARSGAGTTRTAVAQVVTALVELWQSNRALNLAAIAASTDDETVRELRAAHLRELSLTVVEVLEAHYGLDDVADRRRVARAMASLMATLDQRLMLGELYPAAETGAAGELAAELMRQLPEAGVGEGDATATDAAADPPADSGRAPVETDTDDEQRDRRLTEADYAAWADRMRSRRRDEIDLFSDEAPEPD